MEFCPVCMLRQALAGGVESGESSASEETVKPAPEQVTQRFEHYELVTGEDGKPVELGRGAMGVTYKAFDVDLHCPVTLKVISERYLGDESARLRFLREARAAARLAIQTLPRYCTWAEPGALLLRDGVCRGGNAGESHQTLRPAGGKAGAGNRDAGRPRFGCGPQAEARSPGHQTKQHHGELGGGTKCNGQNYPSHRGQSSALPLHLFS